ncbi:putative metallopeptidase [Paenibacillus lautus]
MANDKFITRASEETIELLEDMIEKHHPHLARSEFLIMMKHGGWKSKGKPKFSGITINNEAVRMEMDKDLILYLNADMWNKMTEPQKRYVLDHALFGLDVKKDKHEDVLEADDGRPLLKTLPPDIEAFFAVITRHGAVSEDVKRLAVAIKEVNVEQLTIEDAAKQSEEQQQEPREGVRGKINPDGTVDVEDDPNQVTLEEAAAAVEGDGQEGPPMPNDDDLPF